MRIHATVAHQIPGRIRVLIPSHRGDAAFFDQLSEHFAGIEGVRRARSNPTAATFVVEYDGSLDDLLTRSGARDMLDLGPSPAGSATRFGLPLPTRTKPVNLVSGRDLDPMFMAGTGFGAMALLQSMRGQVFVPAATAFWYAVSIFQQSRLGKLEEKIDASGGKS